MKCLTIISFGGNVADVGPLERCQALYLKAFKVWARWR
jgi:hypothetical protein